MDQTYMKKKKILPLVLSMAVPMVLSMLVNALYNIVDSYFVAKVSENAMTAISLVFPLQNVSGAVSIGFGVGANAVTAFYLGREDQKRADGAASASLLLSFVHTVILTVVLLLITGPFLRGFSNDPEILRYGNQYARIVFSGLVFTQIGLIFEKLFQAVGRVRVSMVSMIAGCVTNIILDPVMIFGYGPFPAMGIEGAAVATVIGQAVTLLFYLVCVWRGMLPLHLSFRSGWQHRYLSKKLYGIGIPAILSQALPSLLITVLNMILSAISATDILILGVYYKLQTFIYLSASGIVQGIRPLISYNYGAGETGRVREIVRTAMGLCVIVMSVGTILCLAIPGSLIGMFTDNPATVSEGAAALRIICIGFIVSSVSVVVCGTMEALGFGSLSFLISFMRYGIVILPIAFLLSRFLGAAGVWNSFWIAEFLTAAAAGYIYKKKIHTISESSSSRPALAGHS